MEIPAHGRAFLEALAAVLPPGFELEVEADDLRGGVLWMRRDGSGAGTAAGWLLDTALFEGDAVRGAEAALDCVSTELAVITREPWPATWRPGYRGGLPAPRAEIADDHLYAWFGEKRAPLLTIGPVDLSGVLLRDDKN
jgi:hypothetical protein